MKKWKGYIAATVIAVLMSFLLFSFSCNSGKSANTAYADTTPAVKIAEDSLAVAEAVQNVFRAVSSQVLPSIVQIDVVEKRTVQTPSLEMKAKVKLANMNRTGLVLV